MKILQIMAGAEHGGAETAFVDMCLALNDAGENIEVVTRSNKIRVPRMEEAGIKVHTLPFGGKLDVFTAWNMRKIIKDFKPDIIQTWMSRGTDHTPPWDENMGIPRYLVVARLGSPYKMKYFQSADYFVSITPDIVKHITDTGISSDKVRYINNFADVEAVEKPIGRAEFNTPEDATLLLGLGRLHEDKAFDTLIRALEPLIDVYLWIAGEGPQHKELQDLIDSLDMRHRVKLLGWRSDRAALFQACDICTFISRNEGFGTVFVQAWAQKTPVIVSDADGPRQFVTDEKDALMVPVDDVQATTEAVKKLIENNDLKEKLIENGYERYRAEFTREKCVQNYLEYYHDIRSREEL